MDKWAEVDLTQEKGSKGMGPWVAMLVALLLAGCATSKSLAPVEDRMTAPRPAVAVAAPATPASASAPAAVTSPIEAAKPAPTAPVPAAEPAKPMLAGAENAGKPGYYSVKPGDTMIRIGLETGQNWKDLVRWNSLDNPNVLEVGQVLRVAPPLSETSAATRPVAAAKVETRPLETRPGGPAASAVPANPAAAPAPVATQAPAGVPAREPDDEVNWLWPAAGPVVATFEEGKTKGLVIAGKAGDAVNAAADGKVVYAGSGLRGYGHLIILKHNNTYLTAYAHNQTLLVKEDQMVKRGQRIAEMGATDAARVQLHFEIRRQGKPIDPAKLLPPR